MHTPPTQPLYAAADLTLDPLTSLHAGPPLVSQFHPDSNVLSLESVLGNNDAPNFYPVSQSPYALPQGYSLTPIFEHAEPFWKQPLAQRFGLFDYRKMAEQSGEEIGTDYAHAPVDMYVRDALNALRQNSLFLENLSDNHSHTFTPLELEFMKKGIAVPIATVAKKDVLKELSQYTRDGLDSKVDVFAHPISEDLYRVYGGFIESKLHTNGYAHPVSTSELGVPQIIELTDEEIAKNIREHTKYFSHVDTTWRSYLNSHAKICDVFFPFEIAQMRTHKDSRDSYEGHELAPVHLGEFDLDRYFKQWVVVPTILYNPKRPLGIDANFKFSHLGHYVIGEPKKGVTKWDKYVRVAKVRPEDAKGKRAKDPDFVEEILPITTHMPKYASIYNANTVEANSANPALAKVKRFVANFLK
jgi:hypothetical protein